MEPLFSAMDTVTRGHVSGHHSTGSVMVTLMVHTVPPLDEAGADVVNAYPSDTTTLKSDAATPVTPRVNVAVNESWLLNTFAPIPP